ncbi:MAG: SPOR domain-containing protein [Aestuariivirga sp.]|uniref:SPOR domain-containing protein n=1 Tax=Aestuariivirga sp. TaxID=2650926 RepID=UPI0025BAEC41|nr:SPOR domain-containing protein [Aestuariivirga sp.]MCA3560995.1 SPOR domain-containing protein [Aestuariivirga sp.]
MDQDSSNGAGPDKRNWRERLGIGAKDLPKLSDEFRGGQQAAAPPPAGTATPAPRAPVTKPAPMAPRVAPKPAQAASGTPAAPAVPPSASRATPKAPDNAAQDALAEKLRAQRAAAERLAEQRVQAARNQTEVKKPVPAAPPARPAAPSPRPAAAASAPRSPGVKPPLGGAARPKFSFADETRADAPRPGVTPPLTPPRPALGGERSPPPFLRPGTGAGPNGSLGARPQPAFRPAGTGGGSGYVAPPRLQTPAMPRAGLGSDLAGYSAARRVPPPRPPLPASYVPAPPPDPRNFPEDEFEDDARAAPRLGRPAPESRGQDDFDEVFEDEQLPPRGRASARDLQSAHDEAEEGFADEPRRSRAPLLLGLALLVAGLLTAFVIWFYSGDLKNLVNAGASDSPGSSPVVPAPATPAKVAAPDASSGSGDTQTEAPAARKKQIYDRIVGEQEVTGEMQPTEEIPVPPEAAQPDAVVPLADQVPKIEPQGTTNQIPAPDAPSQGATGQGLPDPEPPPPLPIPGSDQQGSLDLKGGDQVAAASAKPDQVTSSPVTLSQVTTNQAAVDQGGMAAPPPTPASPAQTSSSDQMTLPPPEKTTDGAALVSEAGEAAAAGAGAATAANPPKAAAPGAATSVTPVPDTQITPPAPTAEAEPTPPPPPPAKKTAAKKTAAKPAAKQTDYNNLGSKPVVLVPPSQQGGNQPALAPATPVVDAPAPVDLTGQGTAPAAQKRKTIFDLFNGGASDSGIPAQQAAPTQVASAATQTRQATAPAATAPQATPGGGYVVQLASFRTENEANQEYSRVAGAYPSVVGPLKPQIRQTNVGGSTRYQLGLGPLPTRGDATKVCSELIAAGESDCIVRGP